MAHVPYSASHAWDIGHVHWDVNKCGYAEGHACMVGYAMQVSPHLPFHTCQSIPAHTVSPPHQQQLAHTFCIPIVPPFSMALPVPCRSPLQCTIPPVTPFLRHRSSAHYPAPPRRWLSPWPRACSLPPAPRWCCSPPHSARMTRGTSEAWEG